MTYKNWCKHSKKILEEANKHNDWADRAKADLLTNIGPRLEKLHQTGYMGCGFHYSLEQTFGKLINSLAVSWQPSANWCKNVEGDRMSAMCSRVIYKNLIEQIEQAEKSVADFKKS